MRTRYFFYHFGVLVLLLVLSWLYCAAFVPLDRLSDIPVFDDHPGKYYQFFQTITHTRNAGDFLSMNWGWYGGYPDNLFYPPGLQLLGCFLDILSFQYFDIQILYNLIVLICLISLPILTFYSFYRLNKSWIIALFISTGSVFMYGGFSDIHEGVLTGLLNSRLSLSLFPLVFSLLIQPGLLSAKNIKVGLLVGLQFLLHPVHGFFSLLFVFWTEFFREEGSIKKWCYALFHIISCIILLNGFWLAATFLYSDSVYPLRVLHCSLTSMVKSYLNNGNLTIVIPIAVIACFLFYRKTEKKSFGIWGLFLIVFFLFEICLHFFSFRYIDIYRLHDSYFFLAFLILALLFTETLTFEDLFTGRKRFLHYCICIILMVIILNPLSIIRYKIAVHSDSAPSTFYWGQYDERTKLERLWKILSKGKGRTLFLFGEIYRSNNFRSHVMCIAPLFSDIHMMGGTFTHISPIFARMIEGIPPDKPYISVFIEKSLSHGIFGMSWDNLDVAKFTSILQHYMIDRVVVVAQQERLVRTMKSIFHRHRRIGNFIVFRTDEPGDIVESDLPENSTHWSIQGNEITIGATGKLVKGIGTPYFPWMSCTYKGESVGVVEDPFGLTGLKEPIFLDDDLCIRYSLPRFIHVLFLISLGTISVVCFFSLIILTHSNYL